MSGPELTETPVRPRFFLAMSSALVMVAGMLFGANPAAADSVQVQSFQRSSQTDTCDSPPESMDEWRAAWVNPYDPNSGPTWHPTWEQWANSGNGGWTCTRSVTWARTPTAAGSSTATYALGDIGPGGGLVFYDAGSTQSWGRYLEMAPRNWNDPTVPTESAALLKWCTTTSDVPSAYGLGMGDGFENTAAMADPTKGCASSPAASAVLAYSGTDDSAGQWYIPSKDELNAMCNYARNPSSPASPAVACSGSQDGTFAGSEYGFDTGSGFAGIFWSSSLSPTARAWFQDVGRDGFRFHDANWSALYIRPIRAL